MRRVRVRPPDAGLLAGGEETDPAGRYRYSLWRLWRAGAPRVAFIMLNPSTADALTDDPTVRRCCGFARSWGYGSIEVVNLFAWRATDSGLLMRARDPVGPGNDRCLIRAAWTARAIVAAWGCLASLRGRDREVLALLPRDRPLYCLGMTRSGSPRHPLYLGADTLPEPFDPGCHSSGVKVDSASA